ncbi:Nucleolar protein gar2-related isoform 2 [Senna tora]|uniref:Nucleolar protein gar2-related isoform 2 n=1 Tax=Senna tora TaxID=362788 RepID=A0A835CKF1_9FABA|nr:Nucleolar protein gar2-related isoform 2 [Senna tora]
MESKSRNLKLSYHELKLKADASVMLLRDKSIVFNCNNYHLILELMAFNLDIVHGDIHQPILHCPQELTLCNRFVLYVHMLCQCCAPCRPLKSTTREKCDNLSDLLNSYAPKKTCLWTKMSDKVFPSITLPLIKWILCNFTPDEFYLDPVPRAVLEALNAEVDFTSHHDVVATPSKVK